jgi:hypothetical protein
MSANLLSLGPDLDDMLHRVALVSPPLARQLRQAILDLTKRDAPPPPPNFPGLHLSHIEVDQSYNYYGHSHDTQYTLRLIGPGDQLKALCALLGGAGRHFSQALEGPSYPVATTANSVPLPPEEDETVGEDDLPY